MKDFRHSLNDFKVQIRRKEKHLIKRKKIKDLQSLNQVEQSLKNLCKQIQNFSNILDSLIKINKILINFSQLNQEEIFFQLFKKEQVKKFLHDLFFNVSNIINGYKNSIKKDFQMASSIYRQVLLLISIIIRCSQIIHADLNNIYQNIGEVGLIQILVQSTHNQFFNQKDHQLLRFHIIKSLGEIIEQVAFFKQEKHMFDQDFHISLYQILDTNNFQKFLYFQVQQILNSLISCDLFQNQQPQNFQREQTRNDLIETDRIMLICVLVAKYCNFCKTYDFKFKNGKQMDLFYKLLKCSIQILKKWKSLSKNYIESQLFKTLITNQQFKVLQNKIQWLFINYLSDVLKITYLFEIGQEKYQQISQTIGQLCVFILLKPIQYSLLSYNNPQIDREFRKISFQRFNFTSFKYQLLHHFYFLYWLYKITYTFQITLSTLFGSVTKSNHLLEGFLFVIEQIYSLEYHQNLKKHFQNFFFGILVNLINNSSNRQQTVLILLMHMERIEIQIYKKIIMKDQINLYDQIAQDQSFQLQRQQILESINQRKLEQQEFQSQKQIDKRAQKKKSENNKLLFLKILKQFTDYSEKK